MILVSHREAVEQHFELAFRRSLDETVGEAKANAPVGVSRGMKLNAGSVQGGLRGSITADGPYRTSSGWSARVGSPLRYAAQREFGGTIRASRAPFLVWRDPVTGKWYRKKSVTQRPGGPRQGYRPWLRPAGEKWPGFFRDHLRAIG